MSRTSRRIHGSTRPASKVEDLGLGVKLLHADDQIAILEKPAGLLSARMGDQVGDSIFDVVKAWAKIDGPASRHAGPSRGKDRDSRPAWIIHRLDREVSGVMVFALTNDAYMRLKDDLQVRRITRRYAAVVEGEIPKGAHGTITGFLTDQGAARPVKVLSDSQGTSHPVDDLEIEDDALAEAGSAPKRAITHWQCVASGRGRSLLEVRLDTGRKHQIRAHLASVGHVICGDKLYGSKDTYFSRIGLHAADLRLSHPRTGFEKSFHAPLPREFFIGVGIEVGAWPDMGARVSPPAENKASASAAPAVLPTTLVKKEDLLMAAKTAAAAAKSALKGEWIDSPAGRVFKAFKTDADGKVIKPLPKTAGAPTKSAERTDVKALLASVDSPSMGEDAGWDHVAPWYDDLLTRRKSDHHESVVLPGVVRLLAPKKGERALDVACGEGTLCRQLGEAGIEAVGVDASPKLIAAAQAIRPQVLKAEISFTVGDARKLPGSEGIEGPFDMASCVLALMNIDPLDQVLAGVSYLLKPNGRFVAVMLHPAFRCPGQTHWGEQGAPVGARNFRKPGQQTSVLASEARAQEWAKAKQAGTTPPSTGEFKIFRKVEGYLSPVHKAVVMNPGEVAGGAKAVSTITWHRPLQAYVAAFAKAGLMIDALEEWASVRQSEPGPRSREEDRIRREIPMFLAIRGVKCGVKNG